METPQNFSNGTKSKKILMSEHDEQAAFFDWVRLNRKLAPNLEAREAMELCYAVPNGFYSKSHKVQNNMKAEGLTRGILDVNLDYPLYATWGACPGLRLEFKYRKSPISKSIQTKIDAGDYLADLKLEQRRKRELLLKVGYQVKVIYSSAQAVWEVFNYLPFKMEDYQGIKEFL